jgi:antitoxin (DNA-binding transcriptional repressor) of toxin-antitoxin stability system
MQAMEYRISATDLARRAGEVLGRVRYRGDSFVVDRNGDPVARISPVVGASTGSTRDFVDIWRAAGVPEASFADDLEAVGALDVPPELPWAS